MQELLMTCLQLGILIVNVDCVACMFSGIVRPDVQDRCRHPKQFKRSFLFLLQAFCHLCQHSSKLWSVLLIPLTYFILHDAFLFLASLQELRTGHSRVIERKAIVLPEMSRPQ